jgi:predicted  nucleic acid-binding Zn-ribbon protein
MLSVVLEAIKPWMNLIIFGLNAGVGIIVWAIRRSLVTQPELTAEREERAKMDKRLASVEQTLADAPTRKDLSDISLAISDLRGDMRTFRAEISGARETFAAQIQRADDLVTRTERTVRMITEHLLTAGR